MPTETIVAHRKSVRADSRSERQRLARVLWCEHRALIAVVGIYVLGSSFVGYVVGWRPPRTEFFGFLMTLVLPLTYGVLYLFWLRRCAELIDGDRGVRAGWVAGWRTARRTAWTDERLAGAAIVLAIYPFFAATFSAWKSSIAQLHPFVWDARLIEADRWLHGGSDPWVLTHIVLGAEWTTRFVDVLYLPGWAIEQTLVFALAAIAPPGALRRRFLLAYFLQWVIIGTIAAMYFSSVGPVFLGRLAGGQADSAPFVPLVAKLVAMHADFPLTSVRGQELLLTIARQEGRLAGAGVSAMPSMHVASTVLVALAARHVSVRWARVTTTFAVAVLVGSVHLGWHYALDGYFAAVCIAVLWWALGRFVREEPRWGTDPVTHS